MLIMGNYVTRINLKIGCKNSKALSRKQKNSNNRRKV